jgi:hypothetical protein
VYEPVSASYTIQSLRSADGRKASAYYKLALMLSRHLTYNEFQAIYGAVIPGKMSAALLSGFRSAQERSIPKMP